MTTTTKVEKANGQSNQATMEVKKTGSSKVENTILSLEKRILKVEELNIVISKWSKLCEARKNMKSFSLGNDGLSATITMVDASGREFKTSHNQVVTTVIETVLKELDKSIEKTEEQINFTG